MNQTPAAVLVLAGSVCGYAASARSPDSLAVMVGLAGVGLGLWGVLSLVSVCLRTRRLPHEASPEVGPLTPTLAERRATLGDTPVVSRFEPHPAANRWSENQLSPETSAQLSLVAHMQGRDRTRILEELLRRHLPRYTDGRRV